MKVKEFFEKMNYKNLAAYDDLSENDKLFFDKLFKILIVDKEIIWTNDKLASVVNETKSTVEKRLARIEESGLIIREHERGKDDKGNWRVISRIIKLNESMYTFNFSNDMTRRLYADYLFYTNIFPSILKILNLDMEEWNSICKEFRNVSL